MSKIKIRESKLKSLIRETVERVLNEAFYDMKPNGQVSVQRDNQYFDNEGKLRLQAKEAMDKAYKLYRNGQISVTQYQSTIDYWNNKLSGKSTQKQQSDQRTQLMSKKNEVITNYRRGAITQREAMSQLAQLGFDGERELGYSNPMGRNYYDE